MSDAISGILAEINRRPPAGKNRLAIACFIGRLPSGDLVLWS